MFYLLANGKNRRNRVAMTGILGKILGNINYKTKPVFSIRPDVHKVISVLSFSLRFLSVIRVCSENMVSLEV